MLDDALKLRKKVMVEDRRYFIDFRKGRRKKRGEFCNKLNYSFQWI